MGTTCLRTLEIFKENVRRAVERSKFLRKYTFYSHPFDEYIYILQDNTVKFSMEYMRTRTKNRKYFFFSLVFKQFEQDWIIVETNLVYNLQWREWMNLL